MNRFIRAHGYEAGPTQRPLLAGVASAAIAELPTLALLWAAGSLDPLARAARLSLTAGLAVHVALVLVAGAIYGQVFQRAANDPSGGWLFGLAYGFLGWMAGPVTLLEWLEGRPQITGAAAQGVFGAYLLWGLLVGSLFGVIHRGLQANIDGVRVSAKLRSASASF